jgi:hypothetical protein
LGHTCDAGRDHRVACLLDLGVPADGHLDDRSAKLSRYNPEVGSSAYGTTTTSVRTSLSRLRPTSIEGGRPPPYQPFAL